MKRITVAIVLSLALGGALAGCGSGKSADAADTVAALEETAAGAEGSDAGGTTDADALSENDVAAEGSDTEGPGADAAGTAAANADALLTPTPTPDYGITAAEIWGTEEPETADADEGAAAVQTATGDAAANAAAKGLPAPPDIDVGSWQYILASATHTLPDGYGPEDVSYVGDEDCPIDSRVADSLQAFTDDCEDAGYPCYLSSGYRSYELQKELFDAKVEEYGYDEAATIVLPPGTSEHQTGLCCDITDVYRSPKSPDELSQTETFQWLNAHCEEYGFILRYPENKEAITEVIYEPWHFRYVGQEAAKYIKENDLCLEEFLALYGVEI